MVITINSACFRKVTDKLQYNELVKSHAYSKRTSNCRRDFGGEKNSPASSLSALEKWSMAEKKGEEGDLGNQPPGKKLFFLTQYD